MREMRRGFRSKRVTEVWTEDGETPGVEEGAAGLEKEEAPRLAKGAPGKN